MAKFKAKIEIIGVNPFVFLPAKVLISVFRQAQKERGPIPVHGVIDGHSFIQTLVKYSGHWRLYINGPMLKAAKKKVGDLITIQIEHDSRERLTPIHPKLERALNKNKAAKKVFDELSQSRRKEIVRYINNLKSQESLERNVKKAIDFLSGNSRFVGRDKP